MTDRWWPREGDLVRWTRDDQPGRIWRVVNELMGDPTQREIVPEPEPGAGVQSSVPMVVPIDDLEPLPPEGL